MATLYWGGGNGTWDAFDTAHWYTNAGRTTLSTRAPSAEDDVVFDSASSATSYTITFSTNTSTGAACCKSITVAGPATGTVTFGAGTFGSIYVYGNIIFPSTGMIVNNFLSGIRCMGTGTINCGVSLAGLYSSFYIVGTYTLAAALNTAYGSVYIYGGALNTNNYNVITNGIYLTGTGTINCTTSTITTNFLQNSTTTPITVASANFLIGGTNMQIGAAGLAGTAYNDVTFTALVGGQGGPSFYGENTFRNLNFGTLSLSIIGPTGITFYDDQVVTGTLTVSGQNGSNRLSFKSSQVGATRTLTVNAVSSLTDVDFRDITVTGAAAPFSGTRLGNGGGNSGVTFPAPKTVYWNKVAGGSWYDNAWAATSGGAVAIANYPLPQDSVIINNAGLNTGTYLDASYGAWLTSLTSTKTNAFYLGSSQYTVYGNVTLTAGITGNPGFIFCGRTAQTLTTAGSQIYTCTVNTAGSTVSLADNMTTYSVNLISGGFDTTNKSITTVGTGIYFGNENTGVPASTVNITLGSSVISATGSNYYTYLFGFINNTDGPNISLNAGTSSITSSLSGSRVTFGCVGKSLTFNNVSLPFNNSGMGLYGNNTFNNLTFSSPASLGTQQFYVLAGDVTVTGTLALVGGVAANQRLGISSDARGTQRTITAATITGLTDIDFSDIKGAGAATWSGTRLGDGGGNSGITFAAPKNVYWNLGGAASWTSIGWATTSGGTPAAANYPLPQDTAVFNNAGAVGTLNINSNEAVYVGGIDMSARTSAMTISGYGAINLGKDLTLCAAVTISYGGPVNFRGTGNQTFTTAGKTIPFSFYVVSPSCNFLHGDAFTNSNSFIYISAGSYSTQNFNVTPYYGIQTLSSSPKNFNFGTSTITCSNALELTSAGYAGATLTLSAESASLIMPSGASATMNFGIGGNSFGSVRNDSAQPLRVTTNAIIGTLTNTSTGSLVLTSGTTLAVTNFNYTGALGNVVKVFTDVPGQQAKISYFSGNVGANSVNGGNNTGLTFAGTSPNYLYIKDVIGPSVYNSATNFFPFF